MKSFKKEGAGKDEDSLKSELFQMTKIPLLNS
jgi:hypothetical protein